MTVIRAESAITGKKVRVLDSGFIQLVDVMGSDSAIVQAARVSYGEGTKTVREDRGLIRYLMRHRHTTPFEMCEVKFLVRVPMDCWRQWIRHRTASVNEYSTRYSIAIEEAQRTDPGAWRAQALTNRQGSDGPNLDPTITGESLTQEEHDLLEHSRRVYRARLEAGVAREQARKDLPLSTYTEAYWKIDLHNLFHFLALRMDLHAQKEIRAYATAIGEEFVRLLFPFAWEAFVDYRLGALSLSRLDLTTIRAIVAGMNPREALMANSALSARERRELAEALGIPGVADA